MSLRGVVAVAFLWGALLSSRALEVSHASHIEVRPGGESCLVILDGEGYLGKDGWFLNEEDAEDLCIPISTKSHSASLLIRDKVYGKTYHLRVFSSLNVPPQRKVLLALSPILPSAQERRGAELAPEVVQESLGAGRYPVLGLQGASAPVPGFIGVASVEGKRLRLALRVPGGLELGESEFRVDGRPKDLPSVQYADGKGRFWIVVDLSSVVGLLEVEIPTHFTEGEDGALGRVRIPILLGR